MPALIIGSAPFYARMVEIGLREIDKGVIEAARAMGAKTSTIILKFFFLSQCQQSFLDYSNSNCISWLYSYCRMIGAGGLGD